MKSKKIDQTKSPWNLAGKIKTYPADFVVEEIPLYEPCGEGEHLYITVRKTNMSHEECVRQVAKAFQVSQRDIGCAGRKDFHAVTTQTLSVYLRGKKPEVPESIGSIEVRSFSFHANKLRLGHLVGNRFVIRVRNVKVDSLQDIQEKLKELHTFGLPNFFGPQRFGNFGNNHALGRALVMEEWDELVALVLAGDQRHHDFVSNGEYKRALDAWPFGQPAERNVLEAIVSGKSPMQACMAVPKPLRKLWVNAWQSYLFNAVLQSRMDDKTWNTILVGDLAWKHDGGGRTFEATAEDLEDELFQARVDSFSLSPTGPLWGSKMRMPSGGVLAKEVEAREFSGLGDSNLVTMRNYASGARRPLRVEVTDPNAIFSSDEYGEFVEFTFALPAGSYATVVLEYCLA
ncbi:MAG: tRNA pseudouridine(13) synthase TruD [Planctomycetes bacterium]|nr:tRNA pseudouridine(13) synthase TruD [Planctomycetota bacterium]